MKKLFAFTLVSSLFLGLSTYAQSFTFPSGLPLGNQVVVSSKTVTLPTEISAGRIKLTSRGYQTALVKVISPELAEHTVLNHRNEGEDGPCLFTLNAWDINEVIQDNPAVEDIEFTITQSKDLVRDEANGVCKVTLLEDVTAEIRGHHFEHHLRFALPDRVLEDCI